MSRGEMRYQELGNKPDEGLSFKFTELLGHGLELRSYGTYDNVERPYGRFAKLKGGVQRALMAMEFLPTKILDRAAEYWYGFINAYEEPKFFQLHEVIYVPSESLWKPKTWWALYHETAHILIDRYDYLASEKVPCIKTFIAPRTGYLASLKFFTELAAEIIGYELVISGTLIFSWIHSGLT